MKLDQPMHQIHGNPKADYLAWFILPSGAHMQVRIGHQSSIDEAKAVEAHILRMEEVRGAINIRDWLAGVEVEGFACPPLEGMSGEDALHWLTTAVVNAKKQREQYRKVADETVG